MSPLDPAILMAARQRAILLVIVSSGTFTLAAAAVKALEGGIPLAQLVLFRNLFAMPLLLLMLHRSGGWHLLRPRHPWRHAQRSVAGLCGMCGAFIGFTHLPLATATVLGFTMPFFLTVLSVIFLGERVGWRRWGAVAVGFAGVLLVARPGAEAAALPIFPVVAVLVGALAWAVSMMSIRRLGEAGEHGVTIVLWFAIFTSVVSAVATVPVWVQPDGRQWALLVGLGVISAVAQLLMTEAYRRGETTLLAPFEYVALFWTMMLGAALWGEWPSWLDLAGFAVLVGAGLFIWWREVRLGVKR